ncbi:unnamed protein product [Linum trigynum]|uniref:Rho-GAP domain-containing protein n=1 Tax=Linum trigynum TaxID=586398 RepID=A0AAV2G0X5_9ROSI
MTQVQVLHQSPSHFPSSPTTTTSNPSPSASSCLGDTVEPVDEGAVDECDLLKESEKRRRDQLSLLALLVTLFRKSVVTCKSERRELCAMEISWPRNVRHVAHVTFDRFNGFLGLPVEFEPEVPRRVPSASVTVFGVSTESMQLSYDSRGNSVPTILLLMQRHLYGLGGLQAEGIFRINGENSQEEYVRDQLNGGVVPEGVDVHCLAGLIKAWFRELPTGVLDSLQPEQVMQSQTEEECAELVRHLPPTESALLDWAINLMADVVEQEHLNKMNARNIAMVFAPNMTQMVDPLTALMYAVQVMNFLKTLVLRTLRERQDSVVEPTPASRLGPFDGSGHQSPSQPFCLHTGQDTETTQSLSEDDEPVMEQGSSHWAQEDTGVKHDEEQDCSLICHGEHSSEVLPNVPDETPIVETEAGDEESSRRSRTDAQSSNSNPRKRSGKMTREQRQAVLHLTPPQDSVLHLASLVEKTREMSNLSRIDSRTERIEAWR